ncbi:hypothetical protein BX600DRAFT_534647 [Xylariales sp. PMI_506]|nr:hypothetical protein BX600DRAFT_534647 [Xylariales sp. PMI_506]
MRTNPLTRDKGVLDRDTARSARWRSPLTKLIEFHNTFHKDLPPIETIQPYIVPPWWRGADATKADCKEAGKKHHRLTLEKHESNLWSFTRMAVDSTAG